MLAKRKAWWHQFRGPRGHRGLPGPEPIDYSDAIFGLQQKVRLLTDRVADLERKLGGSQK